MKMLGPPSPAPSPAGVEPCERAFPAGNGSEKENKPRVMGGWEGSPVLSMGACPKNGAGDWVFCALGAAVCHRRERGWDRD